MFGTLIVSLRIMYIIHIKQKCVWRKNIQLLTIFEDEWDDKKEICKSKIESLIKKPNNVIYARKCTCEVLDKNTTNIFLEKTHLQGKCNYDISLGLIYEGNIVSVMTFTHSTDSKKHDIELTRFSSELHTSVIGGFSKLLNHFKINFSFKQLATFADLRWSYGKVYEINGFTKEYEIRPRYAYVGNSTLWKRKHRFGFTKKKLVEKYGKEFSQMSEKQITEHMKLYRIYDCGYFKFIINS